MINTEDSIIISHTNRALIQTGLSMDKFASDFVVPALEESGVIKFNKVEEAGEYCRWRHKNCVQFHRVLRGTTKFPLSWKWAWVDNLPEPFRTECRRELLALAGVLDVPIPVAGVKKAGDSKSRLAHIVREFSEVMLAASPAQDGKIDDSDNLADLERYGSELLDLIEELEKEVLAVSKISELSRAKRMD